MDGNYLTQATIFLVELFFNIFILALLLRYLFTMIRTDPHNPLSSLIIKITLTICYSPSDRLIM